MLLDVTFHCGLNCYTKFSGGQTSVFLSCPYLSCLRRVGVEWQLVMTCSDMMADQWRASCFSKPPLSCFTYVAEWKLSVIPQARCRSCPVTSFHLLCFNGYGHLMGWALEPYEMINFTKTGWFRLLQNGTHSHCQMLGDHASTKPLTTLGLELQCIKPLISNSFDIQKSSTLEKYDCA